MRRSSDWVLDVSVHFLGEGPSFQGRAQPGQVVLDWGATPLVQVTGGVWYFENIQLGNRSYPTSQQGVEAYGTDSLVNLKDVRIRTGSQSASGILASRGAEVRLYGTIELNEDLHDTELNSSFCSIVAEYHGAVRVRDSAGTLSLGNGSLSAGYYGTIELGGSSARITSWGDQSNCLAVNDSGRIDLHGTTTTLCAKKPGNTLIGLEDDGHILAEDATINLQTIASVPGAVILQKSSVFNGGPIVAQGPRGIVFATMSGSALGASVVGTVESVSADTGSYCFLRCSTNPASVSQQRNGKVDIQVSPNLGAGQKQINQISVDKSGKLSLQWNNVGLWYTVEYTTNLMDPSWISAPGTFPTVDNWWSNSVFAPASFYRIHYQ